MTASRKGGRSSRASAGAAQSQNVTRRSASAKKSQAKSRPPKSASRGNEQPPARKPPQTAPSSVAALEGDPTFRKVRALCLALPDAVLTMTWGSPHFRVQNKIFCGYGNEQGKPVLGVKVAKAHAVALTRQPRFWPAPYVGRYGWVSMNLAARKSWDEVEALIRESYELIAPRASRAKLS